METEKKCSNCYFIRRGTCLLNETPILCKCFERVCDECTEKAEYSYEGLSYCTDCMLEHFDVEETKITHYYHDGMYLGSSEELDDVIKNLSEEIKEIE